MTNHTLPPAPAGTDAVAEALANLTDAGLAFTEVATCPYVACTLCSPRGLQHAA